MEIHVCGRFGAVGNEIELFCMLKTTPQPYIQFWLLRSTGNNKLIKSGVHLAKFCDSFLNTNWNCDGNRHIWSTNCSLLQFKAEQFLEKQKETVLFIPIPFSIECKIKSQNESKNIKISCSLQTDKAFKEFHLFTKIKILSGKAIIHKVMNHFTARFTSLFFSTSVKVKANLVVSDV